MPAALRPAGSARSIAALAVLAVAAALLVLRPAPAAADEVAAAQARVDKLQGLVTRTTQQLTAGTRAWEADQAHLRDVQWQLRSTERHIASAEATASAAQAHMDLLARRLYASPAADSQLLLAQSPTEFLGAVRGQQLVEQVAGTDDQVMREARTARRRLQQDQAEARHLAETAQQLVTRSAHRLASLQSLAQSTARQLSSAQASLQAARARQAARE